MTAMQADAESADLSVVFVCGYYHDLPNLKDRLAGEGLSLHVFTSPAQVDAYPVAVRDELFVTEALDDDFRAWFSAAHAGKGFAVLSFGARWIFGTATIEQDFKGRLINFHGTRLPFDRGGGGFSWRIMRGDRIGSLLAHYVDGGIDTGAVIGQESFLFPAHCRKPIDYMNHQRGLIGDFVVSILRGLRTGSDIRRAQPEFVSHYLPRLDSAVSAAIDWRWDAADLERFILAFDDPYPGALTAVSERPVRLKGVHLHCGEMPSHPFEKGLIIRKDREWLVVAAGARYSLIVETVLDESGRQIRSELKVGDRFHTPAGWLDRAMSYRPKFGPK